MRKLTSPFIFLIALAILSCRTGQQAEVPRYESPPAPPEVPSRIDLPTADSLPMPREPWLDMPLVTATDLPDAGEDPASLLFSRMSISQKVGQRFLTWVPGSTVGRRAQELINSGYIGGVFLTPQNIVTRGQMKELIAGFQKLARENQPSIPLLIAVDQEGGRVNRIRFNQITQLAPAFYWGEQNDPMYVESLAYMASRELMGLGCNMNLAPVLDLYGRPDDSVIGSRAMGWKPEVVGELGAAYVRGAKRAGLLAVLRHFPGHGITHVDSRQTLPIIEFDTDPLWERHLQPFRIAIRAGADAIMTAHILYRGIDPNSPATFSQRIVQGILREEMGFEGLVMTDAINAKSIAKSFTINAVLAGALRAGVDLILVSDVYNVLDLEREVVKLIASGHVSEIDINRGAARILSMKAKYGILP